MSNFLYIIVFTILGGFIGYITNYIAVKMLFYPRQRRRFLFLAFQGLIPKYQKQIASQLAEVINEKLLSNADLQTICTSEVITEKIIRVAEARLKTKIENDMRPPWREMLLFAMPEILNGIGKSLYPHIESMKNNIISELKIKDFIYNKLAEFDSSVIEGIMKKLLKKELRYIELLGLVLGCIIGLIQGVIFIL